MVFFIQNIRRLAVLVGIAVAFSAVPFTAQSEIKASTSEVINQGQQLGCLAMNIYHEGRGEPVSGQSAIAAVTMNRVRSERYPDTICEVVWQYKQFSWTNTGVRHHAIQDIKAWQQALVIARMFMQGQTIHELDDATHYHASHVEPSWMDKERMVAKVGRHVFYSLL